MARAGRKVVRFRGRMDDQVEQIAMSQHADRSGQASLAASLITIGSMVGLILGTVFLFGEESEDGPLQTAMMLGLAVAMIVASRSGHTMEDLAASIRSSIDSALGTIFVLLAVGALIGALFLSGTIASVVYYGAKFGSPQYLYILVFVLASALSLAIGSSFTTIAGVGLPFVALAQSMGVSPAVTAGAAVSGRWSAIRCPGSRTRSR